MAASGSRSNHHADDVILFDPPPVEDGWTTSGPPLPTRWNTCGSCHYVFHPNNTKRLLVAFTEDMEEVVQFTTISGANAFQVMGLSKSKQVKANQEWRWMSGLRWDPANSSRQDSAKDMIQFEKVVKIVEQHQHCPGALQESQAKPKIAHESHPVIRTTDHVHRRRKSRSHQSKSLPSQSQIVGGRTEAQARPGIVRGTTPSASGMTTRKKQQAPRPNVLVVDNTRHSDGTQDGVDDSIAVVQYHEMIHFDPAAKAALDAMWSNVRQLVHDSPHLTTEMLGAALEMHRAWVGKWAVDRS